jgi:hypothetical protein
VYTDADCVVSVLEETLVGLILPSILTKTNLVEPCVDNIGVLRVLSEDLEDERLSVVSASELEDNLVTGEMCPPVQAGVSLRSFHRETLGSVVDVVDDNDESDIAPLGSIPLPSDSSYLSRLSG